jgi:hypothetical protein
MPESFCGGTSALINLMCRIISQSVSVQVPRTRPGGLLRGAPRWDERLRDIECPAAVLRDRALRLPTFSHLLIVKKLLYPPPPPLLSLSTPTCIHLGQESHFRVLCIRPSSIIVAWRMRPLPLRSPPFPRLPNLKGLVGQE